MFRKRRRKRSEEDLRKLKQNQDLMNGQDHLRHPQQWYIIHLYQSCLY